MAAGERVDILILRDAAGVRRFRVSLFALRLLWLTPLALLLLLAAAVAVAYHLRQDNLDLSAKAQAMRTELDAAGQGLITLQNIEKILRSRDVTELETLVGSYSADNPGWWKPKVEEGKVEPREREAARPDLSRLLARVDANQAGVDNLRARIDNKKLQLNFDLSNVTPQTNLVGRVEAALVGNDASLVPLKPEKDELSFQIQRFKQIAASLTLPAKIDTKDLYGLKLTILDPAGKTVFAQVYPLPRE
ncbi:MAG: hypothetical protein ACP59X_23755 [Solidesulfovibrio sp. DCME]|uniref:hypothetical protein n=1 Tax=Solidesulfovibrio sp. DCME TaxID=3447380 RepID=UPI003D0CBDCD